MVVLVGATATVWLGLVRLAWAFFAEQLHWRYVAEQSRLDLGWPYRIAGVWGGMEGSLLLFVGIVGVVAIVATRHASAITRVVAAVTVVALGLIDIVLASPFTRLDAPAVRGFGMNPILEHPAMTVHPPLLYAGLASAFAAFLGAVDGRSPSTSRRWHLVTLGLLMAAMTLGGAWSYVEQGWGGYWAWDPVENTSLCVWLAALIALHAVPIGDRRSAAAASVAPWCLAVLGAVLVRSGITPSIHGFAEQPSVGWALLGLAAATIAVGVATVLRTTSSSGAPGARTDSRAIMVVVAAAALVVIVAGTVMPVISAVVSERGSVVRGAFYSRTVGPLVAVSLPFLVARVRRWQGWSTLAHGGALLLVTGVALSTFDRIANVPIPADGTVVAAGVTITNDGLVTGEGPRLGTSMVAADLRVDGASMRPAIVVYPDRGGRLAEVAVRSQPLTDIHVTLEDAADNGGVIITVHRRHGMWLVWLGTAVVTFAALAAARRGRRVPATSAG